MVNLLFKVLFLRTKLLVQFHSLKARLEKSLRSSIRHTNQMTEERLKELADLDSEIAARRNELEQVKAIGVQLGWFIETTLGKIENALQTERN